MCQYSEGNVEREWRSSRQAHSDKVRSRRMQAPNGSWKIMLLLPWKAQVPMKKEQWGWFRMQGRCRAMPAQPLAD